MTGAATTQHGMRRDLLLIEWFLLKPPLGSVSDLHLDGSAELSRNLHVSADGEKVNALSTDLYILRICFCC
jgi:hypothetical protein